MQHLSREYKECIIIRLYLGLFFGYIPLLPIVPNNQITLQYQFWCNSTGDTNDEPLSSDLHNDLFFESTRMGQ